MLVYAKGGEYEDDIEMDAQDLKSENIIHTDLEKAAVLTMYVQYQTHDTIQGRIDAIYPYFLRGAGCEAKIEDLLSAGPEELTGTDEFLEAWILFLGKHDTERDLELLENAVLYRYGKEGLLSYAAKHIQEHPSLMKTVLMKLMADSEYKKAAALGTKAVQMLNPNRRVRGEIAELVCRAAKEAGDKSAEAEMRYQACYSRPSVKNYLDCLTLEEIDKERVELLTVRVEKIRSRKNSGQPRHGSMSGGGEVGYSVSKTDSLFYAFFQEKYGEILEYCKQYREPLGWSASLIRIGVPLLLMGLYQGDSPGTALSSLLGLLAFEAGVSKEEETEEFKRSFMRWKKKHPFPKEQSEACVKYLERVIDARVCAIVSKQYRGSYWKAALLAASMDEVLDSMGGRSDFAYQYYLKFSNYRAFRAELRKLMRGL